MDQNQYHLALFLVIAIWSFQAMSRSLQDEASLSEKHEQWMEKYGRVYKDAVEKEKRFQIFKDNVDYIESFNAAGNKPYKLSINHFADQTNEEFKSSLIGFKGLHGLRTRTAASFKYENVTAFPVTMDWRKQGAVTPIKDQGQCGSCWAFSAVASTEAILQLTSGKLVSLSEQELVDCDTNGENQGCEGGYVEDAFKFIIENGGITTEANYPYKGVDRTCNLKKEASHIVHLKSYEKVPSNSEEALLKTVANQPVSVSVDAGGDFQFHSSGIFTGECGTELDHAVTVVGYGADNDGTKYWIVKNSWGTEWGEEGYIRMKRDIDAKEGLCGIAMDASYPSINYVQEPNASGQDSYSISLMHLLCKLVSGFFFFFFIFPSRTCWGH